MATASNALETLLRPITPHAFVHEYWGKRTLVVPGSEAKIRDLLGDMIGWDDYFDCADQLARFRYDGKIERAVSLLCSRKALAQRDRVGGFLPMVLVEGDYAREYLDSGIPVTIPWVHWFHRAVGEFMAKLTSELVGLRDLVCVFATNPHGGSGVANHFDSFPTLHLQIVGRKRWRVSMEPEVPWPLHSGVETAEGRAEYVDPEGARVERALEASRLREIEVKPGDLIFMPAGTWHQAHPIDQDTLGLELVFNRLSATDVFVQLIQDHLGRTACRSDPPLLLADETAPWSMPEETRRFFGERLDELKAFVRELEADDVELQRVWKEKANGLVPRPETRQRQSIRVTGTETGTERGARRRARVQITPETRLKVSARGPIKAVLVQDNGASRVHLSQQDVSVCCEGPDAAKVAQGMVARQKEAFRAADVMSWTGAHPLAWDVVQPPLQTLVDRGFLTCVADAPRADGV